MNKYWIDEKMASMRRTITILLWSLVVSLGTNILLGIQVFK